MVILAEKVKFATVQFARLQSWDPAKDQTIHANLTIAAERIEYVNLLIPTLVALLSIFALLVVAILPSQSGPNKYGPNPHG